MLPAGPLSGRPKNSRRQSLQSRWAKRGASYTHRGWGEGMTAMRMRVYSQVPIPLKNGSSGFEITVIPGKPPGSINEISYRQAPDVELKLSYLNLIDLIWQRVGNTWHGFPRSLSHFNCYFKLGFD